MRQRPRPVLISTDLDRTLFFSSRASAELGGGRPAHLVEDTGRESDAELGDAAAAALAALPGHVLVCPATSRDLARHDRLRLPFPVRYAVAANGGVVLADGVPDPVWAARVSRLLAAAAPAAEVRPVLAGADAAARAGAGTGAGLHDGLGAAAPPWLVSIGQPDDMCCVVVVNRTRLPADEVTAIAARCAALGWQASLTGRKMYAFPAGFGKDPAVAYIAGRVEQAAGVVPVRLAAGDAEHDRAMLAAADRAWVPAGSELARGLTAGGTRQDRLTVTVHPGHAAAAQITADWLEICGM